MEGFLGKLLYWFVLTPILIIVYINVLNRKKEIGILKAVGITPKSIILSYAILSMFYVSLGILVGLVLLSTGILLWILVSVIRESTKNDL